MSMKNPLTPAGIEPATFQFVAEHLNHCPTVVPPQSTEGIKLKTKFQHTVNRSAAGIKLKTKFQRTGSRSAAAVQLPPPP